MGRPYLAGCGGHSYTAAIWPRADEKGLFAYVVLRTESDYEASDTVLVGVYAAFPTAQQAVYDDAKPLGPHPTRVQQDIRGESEIEWGHVTYRIVRQAVQGLGIVESEEMEKLGCAEPRLPTIGATPSKKSILIRADRALAELYHCLEYPHAVSPERVQAAMAAGRTVQGQMRPWLTEEYGVMAFSPAGALLSGEEEAALQ